MHAMFESEKPKAIEIREKTIYVQKWLFLGKYAKQGGSGESGTLSTVEKVWTLFQDIITVATR